MCGIVGIFSKKPVDEGIVRTMNLSIRHRGPDSDGFYFGENAGIAMRRLKIIDLSTGDQPIRNENGDVVVIFNGEIYNFQGLRDELALKKHVFKTRSDTEVLVHGYEEWGIQGLLERINGMFVFCIYDRKRGKAYFARDRLGEKPLYYLADVDRFAFASELRALLKPGLVRPVISRPALYLYLALHYVPGDMCIIDGVKKLLPGHYLELDTRSLAVSEKCYWRLEVHTQRLSSYQEAKEKVRSLVSESIRMRMISDVPIGLFLSGGIDSSIIASVMKDHSKEFNTFSVGFDGKGFDETEYSSAISEMYGTKHHHFVFNQCRVKDFLPVVVEYMDEPTGDQALLPVYWLCHEARKYVTVVLGGEGGDEVFGGYSYYPSDHLLKDGVNTLSRLKNQLAFLSRNLLTERKPVSQTYPYEGLLEEQTCKTLSNFPLISDLNIRSKLIKGYSPELVLHDHSMYPWYREFSNATGKISDRLRLCQFVDLTTWLPEDLLMKFDKMAMANSLEGRAPFLDHRVVELGYGLPPEWKVQNGTHKLVLRDSFKDVLPEKIFSRPKQGFTMPMSEWLRNDLGDLLKEVVTFEYDDGIDNDYLQVLIDEHTSGKADRGRLIYSILVYKLWVKNLFDHYN